MPQSYKLTYFDLKGLAEGIRYLFSYLDVPFEDNRIVKEDWPELKKSQPFAMLPVLEVDGHVLPQSFAIARFIGRRYGLVPDDEYKQARLESIIDSLRDTHFQLKMELSLKTEEAKTKANETIFFIFTKLDDIASEGFFYGTEPSWVDIVFSGFADALDDFKPDILKPYPNLVALVQKIRNKESLKTYITNRRTSDLSIVTTLTK